MIRLTAEEIDAGRTPSGGRTRAQLAEWGVPWPPPKGWRQRLLQASEGVPAKPTSTREPSRSATLFTDGGCWPNPGPGGWAYILRYDTGEEFRGLGGALETTNNRMEIEAVIQGLGAIGDPRKVTLVSDSQYVCNGIAQWMAGWKRNGWRKGGRQIKNADLWKRLDELLGVHPVGCRWVRGHAGHPENEECDRMAEEARLSLA